jgi:putative tryptophan/tyrosine transport system substrate-binding protein
MRRREFLGAALGLGVTWPLAVRAQARVPHVAVLGGAGVAQLGPLNESLRELGYVDGRNIRIDVRSAQGDLSRLPQLASQLVQDKVDVIVAVLTPAITAAKNATRDIPIVMAPGGDPVGTGLVASLSRPGGNITGVSGTGRESNVKTLELVRDVIPGVRIVGIAVNARDPFTKGLVEDTTAAARTLGIDLRVYSANEASDLSGIFDRMVEDKCQAALAQGSLPVQTSVELALKHRLPLFSQQEAIPRAGGLMSYSASYAERARVVAGYVDKILKGAKPADLPIQQPTRYEVTINLKTARALGLTVPPSLLARAGEVIE